MQTSVTVLNSEWARSLFDKSARASVQVRQGADARGRLSALAGPRGLKPAHHCFNLFFFFFQ
jgi:hypothetical protein